MKKFFLCPEKRTKFQRTLVRKNYNSPYAKRLEASCEFGAFSPKTLGTLHGIGDNIPSAQMNFLENQGRVPKPC
jgi:hypothetical protein